MGARRRAGAGRVPWLQGRKESQSENRRCATVAGLMWGRGGPDARAAALRRGLTGRGARGGRCQRFRTSRSLRVGRSREVTLSSGCRTAVRRGIDAPQVEDVEAHTLRRARAAMGWKGQARMDGLGEGCGPDSYATDRRVGQPFLRSEQSRAAGRQAPITTDRRRPRSPGARRASTPSAASPNCAASPARPARRGAPRARGRTPPCPRWRAPHRAGMSSMP